MSHRTLIAACAVVGLGLPTSASAASCSTTGGTISSDSTTCQTLSGGDTLTVASDVTLSSSSTDAVTVKSQTSGVTITNYGTISDTDTGSRAIVIKGSSQTDLVITNYGTITASGDDAIHAGSSSTPVTSGSISLVNYGTISSTGTTSDTSGQAVDFDNTSGSVTVSITNYGTISAADSDAVRPGANATVYNYGTIVAGSVDGDTGNDGIDFQSQTGGTVYNGVGATITGARHGITGDNAITVYNAGTITGLLGSGINIDSTSGTTTVVNYATGVIVGNAAGSTDGDAIDVDYLAVIKNYGSILAYGTSTAGLTEAITIGGGEIDNYAGGLIYSVQRAITVDDSDEGNAYGATTIYNAGTITGDNGEAIRITSTYDNTITNDGTINGSIVITSASGTTAGDNTITNTGTINGSITTGSGNDTINLYTGSVITGSIDGGDGINTLNLLGDGAATTLSSAVSNFSSLVKSGSGTWVVSSVLADGAYSGNGALTVTVEGGTLVLTGANTYTGGTVLESGEIEVGSSSALGTGTLTMYDGTTLGFTVDGLTLANDIVLSGDPTIDTGSFTETLSGAISGTGDLVKTGTGTLILTGTSTYTGATTVAEGTLQAGSSEAFSAGSAYTVASGATLALDGYDQTIASLTNAGTVSLSAAGQVGTVLTVTGDYVGQDGVLELNATDSLVIGGNASGSTTVVLTGTSGLGALTTGNGIEVIEVYGTSTASAFSLAGTHVDAGAYQYYLYKGDASGSGSNWYLRSETVGSDGTVSTAYRSEVPLYAALPAQLRLADGLMLGDLHRRRGETATDADHPAWARVIATSSRIGQSGTPQAQSSGHFTGLQVGSDLWRAGGWHVGVYAGYLHGQFDVTGNAGGTVGAVGGTQTDSSFVGAYGTRTWADQSYVDVVLQAAHHHGKVNPYDGTASTMSGKGATASVEVGRPFALGWSHWQIEPQAQVMYQRLDLEDTAISGSTRVSESSTNAWLFRVGARLKGDYQLQAGRLQPYARVNVDYSPSGFDLTSFATSAASTTLASGSGYTSMETAAGATWELSKRAKVYGELGYLWSLGGHARVKSSALGSLGVRINW
ncbi:MAG: autotransporter outer membrane beta-barrel domain-containing protein [Xenophilus sp.]